MSLGRLVQDSATRSPGSVAVRGPDGELSYGELDAAANRVARALCALGVRTGDRVAIALPKSARAVAAMQGVLRIGAAYVPIDPRSPAARARMMLEDCRVAAVVATAARAEELRQGVCAETRLLEATDAGPGWTELDESPDEPPVPPQVADGDLAYILYTSGSTGRPKGVCISHGNALAFVRWAVEAIGAREDDRFSNHAPFHFDLSVLDLYAAFSVGARVCIVGDEAAYMAEHLLAFLESERITVWYSVPSAILLMMDRGGLLEAPPTLRALLFAGEPFPVKHLRRIREAWPGVAMWNLYGPTETNVCTAYRVDAIAGDQADIPIGRATCGDRVWLKRGDGTEVPACAAEGELVVAGPTVFLGYWGQPAREGAPYATGDMVRADADGLLHYIGRRDHMVKLRGFRVELGEVEAALLGHAAVKEAAAIVLGEGLVARLVAVLGVGDEPAPTLLDVKRHCAIRLPRYMIPDDLQAMPALPRTGNGKVDRQALLGALKQSR